MENYILLRKSEDARLEQLILPEQKSSREYNEIILLFGFSNSKEYRV